MDTNKGWGKKKKKCCQGGGQVAWDGLASHFRGGVAILWVWKLGKALTVWFCKILYRLVFTLTAVSHHTYYKLGEYLCDSGTTGVK